MIRMGVKNTTGPRERWPVLDAGDPRIRLALMLYGNVLVRVELDRIPAPTDPVSGR